MENVTPEIEHAVIEFIEKLSDFSTGKSRYCPNCGQDIEGAHLHEKTEPEVYALYLMPCHCRLGLWTDVPQWMKDDGLPVKHVSVW